MGKMKNVNNFWKKIMESLLSWFNEETHPYIKMLIIIMAIGVLVFCLHAGIEIYNTMSLAGV